MENTKESCTNQCPSTEVMKLIWSRYEQLSQEMSSMTNKMEKIENMFLQLHEFVISRKSMKKPEDYESTRALEIEQKVEDNPQ